MLGLTGIIWSNEAGKHECENGGLVIAFACIESGQADRRIVWRADSRISEFSGAPGIEKAFFTKIITLVHGCNAGWLCA